MFEHMILQSRTKDGFHRGRSSIACPMAEGIRPSDNVVLGRVHLSEAP